MYVVGLLGGPWGPLESRNNRDPDRTHAAVHPHLTQMLACMLLRQQQQHDLLLPTADTIPERQHLPLQLQPVLLLLQLVLQQLLLLLQLL